MILSNGAMLASLSPSSPNGHKDAERYRNEDIKVDGRFFTTGAIVAAARYVASVELNNASVVKGRVEKSRQVIADKVISGASVYGLSTGLGGSADTRTDKPLLLGHALLQHQHIGSRSYYDHARILGQGSNISEDELAHSRSFWSEAGSRRWENLRADVVPVVPLRGSISASGDLSPLSYIVRALVGNPSIQLFHGSRSSRARTKSPSDKVLKSHSIEPIALASKEHLGILNGPAFSAAVAALAVDDAIRLTLLAQVCTAMGTEALRPLSSSHCPQFLGPQIEDLLAAVTAVTQECNSTTDNPLIESETATIHHGGNFQAMAITNAMEKARLALHRVGELLFSQSTELSEMHNQAINSLALISARATVMSLEVLSMLTASYLYLLCLALDLRALTLELRSGIEAMLKKELVDSFDFPVTHSKQHTKLSTQLFRIAGNAFEKTTIMDSADQMRQVAASTVPAIIQFFEENGADGAPTLSAISEFQGSVATRSAELHHSPRGEFLTGVRVLVPASPYLGKTRAVYEFVRKGLGIKMHGAKNYGGFVNGIGDDVSIGQNISKIYEAIYDRQMQNAVVATFV
ncbi:hypothetical protein NLJ89_g4970 [Agrocybe chaxingu]|uniref:Phenylalanine ammonia-lyase n=1 Tax=Agrocybe chaxingu TaxID=84603 RepID=A0A9W8K1I5_9AGAR|nr:hypothetical protein NLJ89_g4970 [Agrocybe chaxingu]